MPTRRPHVKSRHGCTQCKTRRTKCDEIRPICTKCTRKNIACSFGNDSFSLVFINGPSGRGSHVVESDQAVPSSAAASQSRVPPPATNQKNTDKAFPLTSSSLPGAIERLHTSETLNTLELENLHLMCHYFTHTWQSIVSDNDGEIKDTHHDLWHDLVPELALAHPFLLHALLAISAVHLALTTPTSSKSPSVVASVANLARHHYALSLPLMRQALGIPIISDIIQPLFACSTFVTMYAFANSLMPDGQTAVDVLEEFADGITTLHGMSSIVQCDPKLLQGTPFSFARLPTPSDPAAPLRPATEGYLAALIAAHARMAWPGGHEEAEGYMFMINILRFTFHLHREIPDRMMKAIPFAIMLPDPVLAGIREQQPLALCLVAGYAIVLHTLREYLWVQGWGRRVIEGVERKLAGTVWEEVIVWPLRVTSTDSLELEL